MRKRLLSAGTYATLVGAAGFVASCANSGNANEQVLKLGPDSVGFFAGSAQQLCGMDTFQFSPSKKYIIASSREQLETSFVSRADKALFIDSACAEKSGLQSACLNYGEGLDGIRPISWSDRDRSVFIVENRKSLLEVRIGDNRNFAKSFSRVPLSTSIGETMVVAGPTSATTPTAERQRFENADRQVRSGLAADEEILQTLVSPGNRTYALAYSPSTLRTFVTDGRRRADVALSRGLLRNPVLGFGGSALSIFDTGFAQPFDEQPRFERGGTFDRPILSPQGGQWIGHFSPSKVSITDPRDDLSRASRRVDEQLRESRNEVLIDFAVGDRDHFAWITTDTGARNFHLSLSGKVTRFSCGTPARFASSAAEGIGTREWPLDLWVFDADKPKGVAVLFLGGPAGDPVQALQASAIDTYSKLGWSVIIVNYSGSSGSGPEVANRLQRRGLAAFSRDAELVSNYLDRKYPGATVIVHGESFGASPAITLDAMMDRPGGIFLGIPYLRSYTPAEWLSPSKIRRGSLRYQALWEKAIIGVDDLTREAFNRQLESLAKGRNGDRSALFVFGSFDRSSRQSDIQTGSFPRREVIVVPESHASALSNASSRAGLESWINAVSAPIDGARTDG